MDIAMTAPSLQAVRARRFSLFEALSILHVPIIETSVVQAHKRHTIAQYRTGIYKIIGPALYFLSTVASAVFGGIMAGVFFFVILSALQVAATFLILLIGTGLAWGITSAFGGPSAICMILFLSVLGSGVTFFGFLLFVATAQQRMSNESWQKFENAIATWQKLPILSFEYKSLHNAGIPDRLHNRVLLARLIPGTQVHILKFQVDPLLCVTRQYGPFKLLRETAYIGGWDTNNPAIDNA